MSTQPENFSSRPPAPLAGGAEPTTSFQPENIFKHCRGSHQWLATRRSDKQPRSVRTGKLIDVFNLDHGQLVSFDEACAAVRVQRTPEFEVVAVSEKGNVF